MKYIFWQNILSIHQSAFIRNLSKTDEVILIVEAEIDVKRKASGWKIPDFGDAQIVIKPTRYEIESFFSVPGIHIFTGINSFTLVYEGFRMACKVKGAKIWVQSEPYNWVYGKVMLRKLKYRFLAFRYRHKIEGILAISSKAQKSFIEAKFHKDTIFRWAYFTEIPKKNINCFTRDFDDYDLPNLIYVGSLDERKNLLAFLPFIKESRDQYAKFSIYGSGELLDEMKKYEDEKISFYGNLPNEEISAKIRESDILILPSLFDGWGAVVNEALMVGTRVLCSINCGASDLVRDDRGEIFNFSENNFEEKFKKLLQKKRMTVSEKETIISWSKSTISGEIAVDYFRSIMNYKCNPHSQKPLAPWG